MLMKMMEPVNRKLDALKSLVDNRAFIGLSLLLVTIVVLLQSPLAPYAKGCVWNDSSIFITIARGLLDGDVLYKDITDHKGPLIFLINALGIFLANGKLIGIWCLEVISLFVTSLFMFRTARYLCDKVASLVATCLSLLFLMPVLQKGNLTEEWALPYIAISLSIFVGNMLSRRKLSLTQLFVLSFTFVMAFLLKATYVCVWCAFGLIIMVNLIKERRFKLLVKYIFSIALFSLLTLLPFFIYFIYHDALYDAYYWMIDFNVQYSASSDSLSTLFYALQIILGLRYLPIIVILTFILIYLHGDHNKCPTLLYGSVLSILLTAYTCAIGNRYEHYYIVFAPLLVLVYGYVIAFLKIDTIVKGMVLVALIAVSGGVGYVSCLKGVVGYNYSYDSVNKTVDEVAHLIQKHSKPSDTMMGDGLVDRAIYVYSDRKCVNKYLSNAYSPDIFDEMMEKKPQIVVHNNKTTFNERILDYYDLVETFNNYEIYALKQKR